MRQCSRYSWPKAKTHPKMLVVGVYGEIWEFTYFFASSDIWKQQRSRCGWPNASTKLLVVKCSRKFTVWLITFHLVTGDQQWRRAFRRWTFACYWPHHAMYKTNLDSDHLERSERILFSLFVNSEPKYQLNPPSILSFFIVHVLPFCEYQSIGVVPYVMCIGWVQPLKLLARRLQRRTSPDWWLGSQGLDESFYAFVHYCTGHNYSNTIFLVILLKWHLPCHGGYLFVTARRMSCNQNGL